MTCSVQKKTSGEHHYYFFLWSVDKIQIFILLWYVFWIVSHVHACFWKRTLQIVYEIQTCWQVLWNLHFGPLKTFSMIPGWVTVSRFMIPGGNDAELRGFVSFNVKPGKPEQFWVSFILYSSKSSQMKVKERPGKAKTGKRLHESLETNVCLSWQTNRRICTAGILKSCQYYVACNFHNIYSWFWLEGIFAHSLLHICFKWPKWRMPLLLMWCTDSFK